MYRCPEIIEGVRKVIHSTGLHALMLNRILAELPAKQLTREPKKFTVRRILREHFGLTFKTARPELARYNDESFDEKRVWISRLVTQFMMDEVLIISIDESNFQSSYGPGKKWQPGKSTLVKYDRS